MVMMLTLDSVIAVFRYASTYGILAFTASLQHMKHHVLDCISLFRFYETIIHLLYVFLLYSVKGYKSQIE